MTNSFIRSLLVAAALVGGPAEAPATVILSDDLNSENGGVGLSSYTRFANGEVSAGAVDLIGTGPFDFFTMDLAGAISPANILGPGDNSGPILDNVQLSEVPQPGSLLLLGGGLAALGFWRRRQQRRQPAIPPSTMVASVL